MKYIVLAITVLMFPRAAKGQIVTCDQCTFNDIGIVIANILKFLFAIAIPITVGMIVFGALQLVTSGGSPEKAKQGKDTMKKAVIGLVIVFAAYLIATTIKRVLTGIAAT